MPKALTDADVMKGGLGGTDGTGGADDGKGSKGGSSADDGKGGSPATVSVGGVEFPAELGGKLQTLVEGFSREIDHLKGQVHTLSSVQQLPPKGGKKAAVEDDDDLGDIDTQLFTDPKGTLNKVIAKFEKKVAAMIEDSAGKVDAKHTAANQEKEFWGLFYGDNPDLKEHDFLARAVLNRDYAKLATKTVDEALKHVATETKKVLLKSGTKPAGDGKKAELVEGAGSRAGAGGKPDPAGDDEAKKVASETLSGFLKSRREARRAGVHKGA